MSVVRCLLSGAIVFALGVSTSYGAEPSGEATKEWLRSDPDMVVYLPKGDGINDGDNEHFLVFPAPKSDELLGMWTQSSVEGHGDNHVVIARSSDAENWSDPVWIAGTHPGTDEPQASWGFPVVAESGRIYCFYGSSPQGVEGGLGGIMGCHISNDNGVTWTEAGQIVVPPCYDSPATVDSEAVGSWIVWQKPIRDGQGRWLAGFTRWTKEGPGVIGKLFFMRFENIDEGPDVDDLKITWLPGTGDAEGISLPRYVQPQGCEEPSVVLLPDGRLFCVMRTKTGHIWYTVSADDGRSWRDPEVLRYRDDGEPVKQPLAACPVYELRDGRFLLLFHNNDHYARNQLTGEPLPKRDSRIHLSPLWCYRRPAFIAVGEYREGAHQPIWFAEPKQILDTDAVPLGPKWTDEVATYTSVTDFGGRQILWYPDRKHFLLGKVLADELLDSQSPAGSE